VADYAIDAAKRDVVGKKVRRLRAEGFVPITVYGPNIKPVSLKVPYRPLEVALMQAGGTGLIDINVDGEIHTVLAREVQRDVLKRDILHVDFFAVDATVKIRADIPIHLVGESPAVAAREGILITGPNAITVETLPDKLISFIEVDLSSLEKIGDSITVSDLDLSEDIVIINDPDDMLARISQTSAARAELLDEMAEEEEPEVEEGAEPEVIGRGKEEEDEEEED
jgi:large subunit ribosomal protein L25